MTELKRLDIVWADKEIDDYESILGLARKEGAKMPNYVKQVLRKHIKAIKNK